MKAFKLTLPDSATVLGAIAVNLADRGRVFAHELDLTEPEEIRSHLKWLEDQYGWPTTYDQGTDCIAFDDARFDDEHGDYEFQDSRGVRCHDCKDLRQNIRLQIDQNRSYRRLVIQDALMPILRCLTTHPVRGREFITAALAHATSAMNPSQVPA